MRALPVALCVWFLLNFGILVDRRKISQLKRSRDGLPAQLGDLPRE
jgi:hypothetical protein